MLNIGIIGATGYTAGELIEILLRHQQARISYLAAKMDKPQHISEVFPRFKHRIDLVCENPDYQKITDRCELIFLALPHTVSMEMVPRLFKSELRIIDLSADYRLKDIRIYEQFYKVKHKDKLYIKQAVYGLPEINRERIKTAKLVANPGCYPTAAILGIIPCLVADLVDPNSIFIDAKSGVSGAGRKVSEEYLFAEVSENFKTYKINRHQHIPEIDQELSKFAKAEVKVTLVPHLLPLSRGILETIYLKMNHKSQITNHKLIDLYKRFYKKEPFVRTLNQGKFPQIKDVVGTNFCDIGLYLDTEKSLIIIVATIDNLLKGAAGQAVQNMNIMYEFTESMALV